MTLVMRTRISMPPKPRTMLTNKSCVSGRENFMPANSMAIALASPGPIQIGNTRVPSISCRMTTGVFDVRSSPRLCTFTSIKSDLRGSPQIVDLVGLFPAEELQILTVHIRRVRRAAEVTVRGCRTIDRTAQLQRFDDCLRTEIKDLAQRF